MAPDTRGLGPRWLASVVILAATPQAAPAIEVVEAFPTNAPHALTGACFHNGDLYGLGKGNLLIRYDPATGDQIEVVSPLIPGLTSYHFHGIAAAPDGTFWVAEIHSRTFFKLRFSDYEVIGSLEFEMEPGHPPFGMTIHNGHLWAGHHSDGPPTPVHAIDPRTGEVVATLEFGAADVHGLVWAAGCLWALDNRVNEIVQVHATGEAATPRGHRDRPGDRHHRRPQRSPATPKRQLQLPGGFSRSVITRGVAGRTPGRSAPDPP